MAIADEDVASLRFDDTEEVWLTRKYLADVVRGYCKIIAKANGDCRLTGHETRGTNCISGNLPDSPFKSIATLS